MIERRGRSADEIFADALELETREREAFVARECRNNGELRSEVESLLASHRACSGRAFLETSPVLRDDAGDDPGDLIGAQVGAYEIESVVASGGMGTVYLARRSDQAYEKRVAVKVMRGGRGTRGMMRRFHRERQALAVLDHPNITRLLDGGITACGRPHLVMEYVDGVPLDRYCDERQASIAARVRIFLKICDAVETAHRGLIIHRDLKPNNILVTADGEPKLLDFGIAKALEPGALHEDTQMTGPRALTTLYASPEQIQGRPVTTATDVYSLGVVLFELLSGHRVRDIECVSAYELERAICEEEPPLASAAAMRPGGFVRRDLPAGRELEDSARARCLAPDHLRRRLVGDLDNILLRAMQTSPAARYGSVRELADDLRRHLAGEPVVARKGTMLYRGAKFVRRNAAMVAVATVLALALLGGSVGSSMAYLRIRMAEKTARAERLDAFDARAEAQSIAEFLQNLLAVANPYRLGRDVTVLELLADAGGRIESELADQPAVEAGVRLALAKTYAGIWHWGDAVPHLRRAVELYRELPGSREAELADTLSVLGRGLCFRDELARRDDSSEWEGIRLQREALALRRGVYGDRHRLVAESITNLAFAMWSDGDRLWERADALYREALAMFDEVAPTHPDHARALFSHAAMLGLLEEYDEAERLLARSLAIYRTVEGPTDRYYVQAFQSYSHYLIEGGLYGEAIELLEECDRRTPPFEHWQVHEIRSRLSWVEWLRGDLEQAERHACSALAAWSGYLARQYQESSDAFAKLVHELDGADPAAACVSLLLEHDSVCRQASVQTAERLLHPANVLAERGRFDAAEKILAACLPILTRDLPPQHELVRKADSLMAWVVAAR